MTTPNKVRISTIREMKTEGRRIAAVTAYDAITGAWADAAGIDMILVGDSLGNTVLGREGTLQVRLEDMIHHGAAVARGARRALRIGDMPFMTYKISAEQALGNAARLIQEGRVEAVKLEGGREMAPTVERLVDAGLPVLGHIGLLPQSVHAQGGYRVQGRDTESARLLLDDALALEQAGAFAVVLEGIPSARAEEITARISIPTIGIGAGAGCDGQILVIADVLGMTAGPLPRFARAYARLGEQAEKALREYLEDVREGHFPDKEHSYDR